jgi:hypothetical protein
MSTMPPTAEFQISTTSQQVPQWTNSGQAPTITVNGQPFAQEETPEFPSGFQLVIMDAAGDLTDPANIWFNNYIALQNDGGQWGSTYTYMYSQIVNGVLTTGNIDQQLILLASFGLDLDTTPNNDGLDLLLARGAGPQLQVWAVSLDPGSQGAGWVSQPASYILIGGSGYGYAGGTETFVSNGTDPAPASVTVTLQNNVPPTPPTPQAAASAG